MNRYSLRPWISWGFMLAAIAGVTYLGYQENNQSSILRLASGERGSYAYQVGVDLKKRIEQHSEYKVELVVSEGSSFNRSLLKSDQADVAILTPANTEMTSLTAIAPISRQHLQVIVNADSRINSINDLPGHRIALGDMESDHRKQALRLLAHYQIDDRTLRNNELALPELLAGRQLDGAIVSESLQDSFLREMMETGRFKLLPITANEALASMTPHVQADMLPRGSYPTVQGPMPTDWVPTMYSEAVLATRHDAANPMVEAVLATLMSHRTKAEYPLLTDWVENRDGKLVNVDMHDSVRRYFDPYGELKAVSYGILLQAWHFKFWILCVVVLLVTGYARWKHFVQSRIELDKLQRFKRIEKLLEDISELEQAQSNSKDYRVLTTRLNEVRQIKQDGLKVAIELEMTDSQIFQAFYLQCDQVIRDIQWKLSIGMNSHSMMAS